MPPTCSVILLGFGRPLSKEMLEPDLGLSSGVPSRDSVAGHFSGLTVLLHSLLPFLTAPERRHGYCEKDWRLEVSNSQTWQVTDPKTYDLEISFSQSNF